MPLMQSPKKTLLDGSPTAVTIFHPTENRYRSTSPQEPLRVAASSQRVVKSWKPRYGVQEPSMQKLILRIQNSTR
jgi:hypothetical protein